MEFSFYFNFHFHSLVVLAGLLALFFAFGFRKRNKSGIPEPSGAWPITGHLHLLQGKIPIARTLGAMADKLGPIFSLQLGNRRAVVVSSSEIIKECFTTNDETLASRPSTASSKYLWYGYAGFAMAPYGPYWREIRKMVTLTLFTNHKLEKLKHVRATQVNQNVKDLHQKCSIPTKVAISKWFEDMTLNITIRMLVGKQLDSEGEYTETSRFKAAVRKAMFLSGAFVVSDTIPSIEWLDIGGYLKSMKQTFRELDQMISKWLDEHIRKRNIYGDSDGDFMDVMMARLAKDPIVSDHNHDVIIKATTLTLVLGGSESTGDALTWALSLLLNNPDALKTVQDKLDANVGRNKRVEESDIKNLTYLQAVVKETLRLFPSGPLAAPHETTQDCYISGYHIPKGTCLIVNLLKLHRDPRVWSDPDEFKPERFLKEHAHVNYSGQNFEYIPFSSGRRMCPATTHALKVIHLILASLLQGFDVSTPKGMAMDMSEGLGLAIPKVEPLQVLLTPRLPLQLYQ